MTNPARTSDALWQIISHSGVALSDMLIFLPSRRAVRTVEKMLVEKSGSAIILPHLVALGEGADEDLQDDMSDDAAVVSNMERVVVLAKLLSADANIKNISNALPVAHDLVRMQDYLENEGIDAAQIDWNNLIDEKYATHFQNKAQILSILSAALPQYLGERKTQTQIRNADIRAWINYLHNYKLVIVCGSTASVPATSDLMAAVAALPHGRVILSGMIDGADCDFALDTNPYNAEYKFLSRVGIAPRDVIRIDVGASSIEFFNSAFSNSGVRGENSDLVRHCHLIECNRESEEAAAIAEIAVRATHEKKSVLIITPDAAGSQRAATALMSRGIMADFSGGVSGTMTVFGRAILNLFDDWIDCNDSATFEKLYMDADFNLFEMIVRIIDSRAFNFTPEFDITDAVVLQICNAIKALSDCVVSADIKLTLPDARAFIADAIGAVSVRPPMQDNTSVVVLGTIESRMQTADVVILSGLIEGIFPSTGYENAWLPRSMAEKIGLPSPNRKVSLMALDFMNLSCGGDVYWTRSRGAGGVQTTESRFLSRVAVAGGAFDVTAAKDILSAVRARDNVAARPLDYSAPTPPADWSDVYVTELELLIHNPYAFYARHILRLKTLDDYWLPPDSRAFGNLVHSVIENSRDLSPNTLVAQMDARAHELLGADSIMFHFWHKRFLEIAPIVANELSALIGAVAEIGGSVKIAGRVVRARADRIWDGGVIDIKTGAAPSKNQLLDGTMPQLPLEAYILQNGGFPINTTVKSQTPIMTFLQLKNNDVRPIVYNAETTAEMMRAAVDKTTEIFNIFSAGGAPYEYREQNDKKYRAYDDLARVRDL